MHFDISGSISTECFDFVFYACSFCLSVFSISINSKSKEIEVCFTRTILIERVSFYHWKWKAWQPSCSDVVDGATRTVRFESSGSRKKISQREYSKAVYRHYHLVMIPTGQRYNFDPQVFPIDHHHWTVSKPTYSLPSILLSCQPKADYFPLQQQSKVQFAEVESSSESSSTLRHTRIPWLARSVEMISSSLTVWCLDNKREERIDQV